MAAQLRQQNGEKTNILTNVRIRCYALVSAEFGSVMLFFFSFESMFDDEEHKMEW